MERKVRHRAKTPANELWKSVTAPYLLFGIEIYGLNFRLGSKTAIWFENQASDADHWSAC